ncbi:MAG: sugar phosphate isomerase/epimerase [Lachnospiraceae bacterium]|nr:sugar phosphate isomerase/epimerase [Lachnospiraceae bacterium]
MDRRIGAQYYTLRESIKTVADFEETCRKVREIGYKTVQISGTPLAAADMKPILDKYGLQVTVTHKGYELFRDNLQEIIDYNKTLGCQICGIGSMPDYYRQSDENLTEFIEGINKAAKELRKEGLYLGYHNHALEFVKYNGHFIMDRLISETDPENIVFIVDTYWLQVGGMDPASFIRKLGKRAMAIHFKDLKANTNNTTEMAEIGEGNLDWDEIINACEEAGAQWVLVEQDTCQRDPFESMKMSYEYLKTKGFY